MDSAQVPLGSGGGPFVHYCDADEIAAFALALNDADPRYQGGGEVPPTYALVPAYRAMRQLPDLPPGALAGGRPAGHGVHDVFIHRPLAPGMVLHTTALRDSVALSSAGMSVCTRLSSVGDDGALVLDQYWSAMYVGSATGGERGSAKPDHAFPEGVRDLPIGHRSLETTRDQAFRYAGASGDRGRVHVDDQAAAAMGQAAKFLHGALSLGLAVQAVVTMVADGAPGRVRRVAVRFSRYAFPERAVDLAVFDAGTSSTGGRQYAFEATSAGAVVLRHGLVEVDAGSASTD